jgi:hypothetical protein
MLDSTGSPVAAVFREGGDSLSHGDLEQQIIQEF